MNKVKQKIKSNLIKNKKIILIFLVIWVATFFITNYLYRNTLGKESVGNSSYENIIRLNDSEVIQKVDTVDSSKTLSLFLSISEKTNSKINIEVIGDDSGTVYGKTSLKDKNILNDSYNAVVLDEALDKNRDKTISIILTSENENGENLGIWYSSDNYFGQNKLSINGNTENGSITCKFLIENKTFNTFNEIIQSVIGISFSFILFYLFLFEPKKENLFSLIILILGIIFIVVIVPLSAPDEDYHYHQTLILSNKILQKENVNLIEDTYLDYEGFSSHINSEEAYLRIINTINEPMQDLTDRRLIDISEAPVYSNSLHYLPHAVGITIARLCKMNFLNTFYMGRFFSLLFYVLCVYISIKNTPVLKNAFGIVATFPMLLQQATTYTIDSWICSLSMVIFAFFLKWMFVDERINKKDFIIVFITDVLLTPAKYIYTIPTLLFVLIPKERFASKKIKILLVLLLMLPSLYIVGKNIFDRIAPIIENPTEIVEVEQTNSNVEIVENVKEEASNQIIEYNQYFSIRYALLNPSKTIKIVLNTIKLKIKTWVCTAIGRAMSGGTLLIPLEIIYGFIIVALMSSLQKEEYVLNIFSKISVLFVCLVIFGLVLATMLVGWTRYDDTFIQGVQGRYFSPIIIYGLSTLNNKKIHLPQRIDKYLILADLLLLFETIICILSYTFVN